MHLKNRFGRFWTGPFLLLAFSAHADVFNSAHFVEPGKMAMGLEPVITMSHGAGIGFNADYIQGINELMDAEAVIGTGTGPRRFRIGGGLTWDFFPDINNQPGIGLMTSAVYYQLPNDGQLVLTGAPYIHKAFVMANKEEVEPFVAIPLGWGFQSATYSWVGQFIVGSMFKNSEKIRYSAELGLNMDNAETYISAGITYYP